MAKTIGKLAEEIRETDKEIIKLLRERLLLTKEFYQREAEDKAFHEELELAIKNNMQHIAKQAKLEGKFVDKFYKQITAHAKQHKKTVTYALLEKLRQNKKEKKELQQGLKKVA